MVHSPDEYPNPGLHFVHFPFVLLYVLHVRLDVLHSASPSPAYVSSVHLVHCDVSPGLAVPAVHFTHCPSDSSYPDLHEVHFPLVASHFAQSLLHVVHVELDDAPCFVENVPSGHLTQSLKEPAPAVVEYVPAGHFLHTVADVAPTVVEYVPAGH